MTTFITIITTTVIFALAWAAIGLAFLLTRMIKKTNRRINETKRQAMIEVIDNEYKNRPTTAVVVKRQMGLI